MSAAVVHLAMALALLCTLAVLLATWWTFFADEDEEQGQVQPGGHYYRRCGCGAAHCDCEHYAPAEDRP